MHTIKLQLEDDVYDDIVKKGIDMQSKFKEFLHLLVNDSYPAIITMDEVELE